MFADSLATQLRVIHALMLREVKTRFGRARMGYVWALIEPLMYVGTFFLLFSFRGRSLPSGMPVLLFLVTGFVPFFLYRDIATRCMGAVESNRALLTFPQVGHVDLVFAKAMLEFVTTCMIAVCLVIIAAMLGDEVRIQDPLGVMFWFTMFGILGLGFGLILSALAPLFVTVERLFSALVIRPMFFASGLFFTANMLPGPVREIALLNPLLHCTELLRSSFFVSFDSPYASPQFVVIVAIVQLALGLLLVKAMRKSILVAAQQM